MQINYNDDIFALEFVSYYDDLFLSKMQIYMNYVAVIIVLAVPYAYQI